MLKFSKLNNYIANINPPIQGGENAENVSNPMNLGSQRASKILQTRWHKLGVEVESWHHHVEHEDLQCIQ